MKRQLFALPLLLLAFAPTARAEDLKQAKPVTVPFELLKTKHITVMVKVNGKGPYRLIFDTGAPVTLLNRKIAKQAGLLKDAPAPSFLENLLGGGGRPVKVEKLEVGDVKAGDVPVIVMDHPTVTAISKVLGPIDGIVGYSFFARHKMTIDYQAQKLTFTPNGFEPPDAMKGMMEAVQAILAKEKPLAKVLAAAAQWGLMVAKENGDEEPGVTIKTVLPGSAAATAGLKAGDRLLTLDDRWTDSVADCYAAASGIKPGTAVKVVVKRDGKDKEVTVKPTPGL